MGKGMEQGNNGTDIKEGVGRKMRDFREVILTLSLYKIYTTALTTELFRPYTHDTSHLSIKIY